MTMHHYSVDTAVELNFDDAGDALIQSRVLLPEGNELMWTPNCTREQVEQGLVCQAVYLGIEDASQMDGWADAEPNSIMVIITGTDVL